MNNHSVAIVDDEPKVVRTYELLLKHRQIPLAFYAYEADEAITKFKKANPRPKVVIVDYRLSTKSGIDVLKAILAEEPETKIIIISGDDEARHMASEAGADLFLKKPARINDITEAINSMLAD